MSTWVRETRALASLASASSTWAWAESRDCVTCCWRSWVLAPCCGEPREAAIFQLGERQAGPRRLDAGAGLVDVLLDPVPGQLQPLLGLAPVDRRGGQRPPGDLDLDRDLLADPFQVGLLADQVGPGRIELRAGQR